MKLKMLAGLSVLALGVSTPAIVSAQNGSAPSANMVLADVKAGQDKRFIYELKAKAWLFIIPVTGKATFDTTLTGNTYRINSRVKTTGLADVFVGYDMRVSASGYVLDDGLETYNYISQNYDGKKNRRVEMTYGADDVAMTATPRFGDLGDPAATPAQKLEALDPLSSIIDIAFQPRDPSNPCGGPMKLFDGKQLTYLNLTYQGEADIKTEAWRGKGIECFVNMERVAGYEKGEKGKNLSGIDGPMRMYFAEVIPGTMTMMKLVVDTDDIGKITVETSKIQMIDVETQEASAEGSNRG
ncbi:MAG: hypothetical protein CMK09_01565 [Ponticaulis sp.]|nr:hypothetical protein [Ponticaulis sp.]|tara:strand:- start:8903 stop:9796 length:894 start_codon:yes stop_codon:yes gene_type:complete